MSVKRIRWRWIGATFAALAMVFALAACGQPEQKHFEGTLEEVVVECAKLADDEEATVVIRVSGDFQRSYNMHDDTYFPNCIDLSTGDCYLMVSLKGQIHDADIPTYRQDCVISGTALGRLCNENFIAVGDATLETSWKN